MSVRHLVSVTFQTTTYPNSDGFRFPKELKSIFGFRKGARVALLIKAVSGQTLFCGTSKFISGPEVTEAATVKHIGRGIDIIVTASHPPQQPSRRALRVTARATPGL